MTDPTSRETVVNQLFRIPSTVTAVGLIAAILLGLVFGGWIGAVLLGLAVLSMVTMLALMWRDMQPAERMLRLSVIVLVTCVSIARVVSTV